MYLLKDFTFYNEPNADQKIGTYWMYYNILNVIVENNKTIFHVKYLCEHHVKTNQTCKQTSLNLISENPHCLPLGMCNLEKSLEEAILHEIQCFRKYFKYPLINNTILQSNSKIKKSRFC
jgi:hypothetical protein